MKLTDEKIMKSSARLRKARPRGNCPDDFTIAAFVDGGLAAEKADALLMHLSRCPACLAAVDTLREIADHPEKEADCRVPLAALERARRLDPAAKGVIEVVINFAKGLAEIVKSTGAVVNGFAPAAGVRGEGRAISETLVTFAREFPPYQAEVDVEKTKTDRGEITVKLLEQGAPARGLRVSIFEENEELESSMLDQGVAVFENLKFGQYRLEITRVGEPIGRITLEMKGDGK